MTGLYNPDELEIIGHRGASWLAPENTLASTELAWLEQADAVEGDFRLTQDTRIVALHDDSMLRTAGVDLRVAEHSLEQLRAHDVGRWKGDRWVGQRIPTLDDLLATVPPGKRFYIEVKCGPEIVDELCRVVCRSGLEEKQIALISFSGELLATLRSGLPGCLTYLVVEFLRDPHNRTWYPDAHVMVDQAARLGLHGIDLMAARTLDPALVDRVRAAGLDLCVWTVDTLDEARRLIDLGVRRITTNRPGWLREQLAR